MEIHFLCYFVNIKSLIKFLIFEFLYEWHIPGCGVIYIYTYTHTHSHIHTLKEVNTMAWVKMDQITIIQGNVWSKSPVTEGNEDKSCCSSGLW